MYGRSFRVPERIQWIIAPMIADYTGSQKKIIIGLGIDGTPTVLDVGCGNGEKTYFVSRYAQRSVGIDPDENLIKTAKDKYTCENLEFQVAAAEYLCFSDATFALILLNESLHHVPVKKQLAALKESHRVLCPQGRLLITEPIFGSGALGNILKLYNDEKEKKQRARHAIESIVNAEFSLSFNKEIHIEYHYKGFDDLYAHYILDRPDLPSQDNEKQAIKNRLEQCEKSSSGDFIVDYSASVWLLTKR